MPPAQRSWMELKDYLHARLVSVIDLHMLASLTDPAVVRHEVRLVVERLLDVEEPLFNRVERETTIEAFVADALGFGPLEWLFDDDRVQEVRTDGPATLVCRGADFEPSCVPFRDEHQLRLITRRLLGHDETAFVSRVIEWEMPENFWLTVRFGATPWQPPALHFRRLRPNVPPAVIPPPRLPPRELRAFVRFVKACHAAGIDDLLTAEEVTLRPLAERTVDDFLAEEGQARRGAREDRGAAAERGAAAVSRRA